MTELRGEVGDLRGDFADLAETVKVIAKSIPRRSSDRLPPPPPPTNNDV